MPPSAASTMISCVWAWPGPGVAVVIYLMPEEEEVDDCWGYKFTSWPIVDAAASEAIRLNVCVDEVAGTRIVDDSAAAAAAAAAVVTTAVSVDTLLTSFLNCDDFLGPPPRAPFLCTPSLCLLRWFCLLNFLPQS